MSRLSRVFKKIYFSLASSSDVIKYYRKQGMVIGDRCEINKNFDVITEPYLVTLGNDVRITSGVKMITHDGGVIVARRSGSCQELCENIKEADIFGRITVGNNVHIGVNAIIMPNVVIGDNVIIGAGAIVTKDIPSNSVAVGVPARVVKTIE